MSRKIFCDDCGIEIELKDKVDVDFLYRTISGFEMCYTCFNKHWKPGKKKFIIPLSYADKKRS